MHLKRTTLLNNPNTITTTLIRTQPIIIKLTQQINNKIKQTGKHKIMFNILKELQIKIRNKVIHNNTQIMDQTWITIKARPIQITEMDIKMQKSWLAIHSLHDFKFAFMKLWLSYNNFKNLIWMKTIWFHTQLHYDFHLTLRCMLDDLLAHPQDILL